MHEAQDPGQAATTPPRAERTVPAPAATTAPEKLRANDPRRLHQASRRRRWFFLLCLLGITALCVAAAVWMVLTRPPPSVAPPSSAVPKVRVTTALPRSATIQVNTRGTVRPRTRTTLSSQVSGTITKVGPAFEAGGSFKNGELLLEIDATNYYADFARAEAQQATAQLALAQARADASNIRADLSELGMSANQSSDLMLRKPQIAKAEADLRAAEAALFQAKTNLERTRITAPFEGRVNRVLVNRGQAVSAGGTPLADIYANDQAEIEIPLSRAEAAGIDFAAKPPALLRDGESTWSGRLDRSTGMIDERDRMLRAVILIDNPQAGTTPLQMGQFVAVEIQGKTYPAVISLPRNALLPGDKARVVTAENKLETRQLDVAWRDVDTVMIRSGIRTGEQVCLTRVGFFSEGMEVEVVP